MPFKRFWQARGFFLSSVAVQKNQVVNAINGPFSTPISVGLRGTLKPPIDPLLFLPFELEGKEEIYSAVFLK